MTIRMAVRRVTGVQKVEGNVKEQTIAIEFDPGEGSLKDIQEAMAWVGYEAEEAAPISGQEGG